MALLAPLDRSTCNQASWCRSAVYDTECREYDTRVHPLVSPDEGWAVLKRLEANGTLLNDPTVSRDGRGNVARLTIGDSWSFTPGILVYTSTRSTTERSITVCIGSVLSHRRLLMSILMPGQQKALPHRQVSELVDRYYGGWKQTPDYRTLKDAIRLVAAQSQAHNHNLFLCVCA